MNMTTLLKKLTDILSDVTGRARRPAFATGPRVTPVLARDPGLRYKLVDRYRSEWYHSNARWS